MNAVVVLAHGSREPEGRAAWNALEQAVRAALPGPDAPEVRFQFGMEGLPDALSALAVRGAKHIAVLPFFLLPGIHLRRTIPGLMAAWRKMHPDVHLALAPPFGRDAGVAGLLARQVEQVAQDS